MVPKKTAHSSPQKTTSSIFCLSREVKSTESQIVNNSRQLEKECGRAVCSHGEDVGMGNDEGEELSEAEGSQSKTESLKIYESREIITWRLRTCFVQILVCCL